MFDVLCCGKGKSASLNGRFRNNAHRDSIRSTESNTSVKSKVIAMQKIIDEIEEPSTSAAIPTVPDSPIQKKARYVFDFYTIIVFISHV